MLPCCDDKFPSEEVLSKLPNGDTRCLIRDMLQREPEKRICIEEASGRLEKIYLDRFDLDDEE